MTVVNKPKVVELTCTCGACPSQWEGRTSDDRGVYIRYRWGCLQIGVGDNLEEAVANCKHVAHLGDEYDGVLEEDAMKHAAADILDFI